MDLIAAKGVALVVLFFIPILMGFLALYLYNRYKHKSDSTTIILSYLNCFAGGFFLGTCLLVVLGQGLDKFEEYRHLVLLHYKFPFFEVGIGVGFFLVALTEKLIHLISAARHKPNLGEQEKDEELIKIHKKTQVSSYTFAESDGDYESMDASSTKHTLPLKKRSSENLAQEHTAECERGSESPSRPSSRKQGQNGHHGVVGASKDSGGLVAPSNVAKDKHDTKWAAKDPACRSEKIMESSAENESEFSLLRVVLLLLALSLHTIFDGLAVGLQTEVQEVWTLLLALAIHRSILSTVLAVELAHVFDNFRRPLLALVVFSLASPLGVAIGIGVTSGHVHRPAELLTAAVLQAMATGVFMYVTCFEILGRDMVIKNDRPLLRVLIAICGFIVITVIETVI